MPNSRDHNINAIAQQQPSASLLERQMIRESRWRNHTRHCLERGKRQDIWARGHGRDKRRNKVSVVETAETVQRAFGCVLSDGKENDIDLAETSPSEQPSIGKGDFPTAPP